MVFLLLLLAKFEIASNFYDDLNRPPVLPDQGINKLLELSQAAMHGRVRNLPERGFSLIIACCTGARHDLPLKHLRIIRQEFLKLRIIKIGMVPVLAKSFARSYDSVAIGRHIARHQLPQHGRIGGCTQAGRANAERQTRYFTSGFFR